MGCGASNEDDQKTSSKRRQSQQQHQNDTNDNNNNDTRTTGAGTGKADEKYIEALPASESTDSVDSDEIREINGLQRKESVATPAAEPSGLMHNMRQKFIVAKAKVAHGINEEPDQYTEEIQESVPEMRERDKRRVREWVNTIAKALPDTGPEPVPDPRELRRLKKQGLLNPDGTPVKPTLLATADGASQSDDTATSSSTAPAMLVTTESGNHTANPKSAGTPLETGPGTDSGAGKNSSIGYLQSSHLPPRSPSDPNLAPEPSVEAFASTQRSSGNFSSTQNQLSSSNYSSQPTNSGPGALPPGQVPDDDDDNNDNNQKNTAPTPKEEIAV